MLLIIDKDHNIRSPQSQVAEVLDTDNIAILYYKWHMVVWTIWIEDAQEKWILQKKMGLAKLSIFYFSFYTWFSRIRKVLTKQWIAFFFMIVFLLYIFFKYFILVLITSSALVRACFCGNTVKTLWKQEWTEFPFYLQ